MNRSTALWLGAFAALTFLGSLALAQDKPGSEAASAPSSAPASAPASTPASQPSDQIAGFEDRSPATLYKEFCSGCHDPGIAGAPKTADKAAWEKLLKERTFEGMVNNTYKGIGVMPKRGTCALCTEDEIRAVVLFMLQKAEVAVPGK